MKVRELLQQAGDFERRGHPAEAMAIYEKIVGGQPSNIDALTGLGRLQLERGQFAEAAKALRRIVTLQPGHLLGQALLGMALARVGQPQEALACFERATAAGNVLPVVLLHMADVLGVLGRHAEALAIFDRLLAADPRNILALNNRGLTLEALGRDGEAADSFRHALALSPNTAEIHFSLGNVLSRLEHYEDAANHYRRAMAAMPGFARGHANLGNALAKLKRWDEALQSLRQAIKLDAKQPNAIQLRLTIATALRHLQRESESIADLDAALAIEPDNADIITRKAYILGTLGRLDEARALIGQAEQLKPDETAPYVVGSRMVRFSAGDPVIAKMEKLAARSDLPDAERAGLLFALGKAYDDCGEFDRAFAEFAAANAIMRRLFEYHESRELAGKARIVEVFTRDLMRGKAGWGHESDRPIFILGMPRSGTTLIEQIIASHPRVFGAGEQQAFSQAVDASIRPGQPIYPTMVQSIAAADLKAIGNDYLTRMASIVPGGKRFTDKLPGNYSYAGLINLVFPNAKIIHVQRNAIDNCFSMFSITFEDPLRFSHKLTELGHFYRAYRRVMDNWRRVLPAGAMLDVQYEDVVNDIDTQARRLIAFCGLPWHDACLAFHAKGGTVRTASAYQVRQPLYRSSVGRWRAYEKHLGPLIAALDDPAAR